MIKPEILAPAGDMERLIMAVSYGADAVYLAGTQFGMRAAAGNFGAEDMKSAAALCREKGVKVYVACNNVMRNRDAEKLPEFLAVLEEIGVNAVIVADMGVMALAKKYAPSLHIHVSTQAGIANYETARTFYEMGASRVILARELTLSEIREIREKTPPELELEAFVHGSMCVSFSGRCLLSNYLAGRDANQGACAQPCRWKYHLIEEKRPDRMLDITEEDGGTFIMNSRDMCMIEHLPELISAGVTSFKIEGRMKSAYYAAVVTNAYRHALDEVTGGKSVSPVWLDEVNKVSHREYSTGFYFGEDGPGQYYNDSMYFSDCDVVAVVESCGEDGSAVLTQRNKFYAGDTVELVTPDNEPVSFVASEIFNGEGERVESTPHPMMELRIRLPVCAPKYSILRKAKTS